MLTKDREEPGEEDGGEEVANGAGAKLLQQEEHGDDGARKPHDERCAACSRLSVYEMTQRQDQGCRAHDLTVQHRVYLHQTLSMWSTACDGHRNIEIMCFVLNNDMLPYSSPKLPAVCHPSQLCLLQLTLTQGGL